MKLFCIPFSGGNTYSYSEFKKYLPEEVEFINLELPGRGKRIAEDLLTNIDDMTEDLFRIIEPEIKGNYTLFGHSLGTLLCFYIVQEYRHEEGKSSKVPVRLRSNSPIFDQTRQQIQFTG